MILHNDPSLTDYHKYGKTPENLTPHFYPFTKTKDFGIQQLRTGSMTIRFTDGMTGDDDSDANGIIVDPGGPALQVDGPGQNPIDATDVNNDSRTTALDALAVINFMSRREIGSQDSRFAKTSSFLDVNDDHGVTAPMRYRSLTR